jgi:tryptophan synthase alpha chain
MNLIDEVFGKLREQKRAALIPFLTVGDPDVNTSIEIIQQLELAGAHMIELGVPYSDPLADGPVIQRASQRALEHGINILDCIHVATRARELGVKLPFILFTYYNPILQLGLDRFFKLLADNDISGIIIPDLPLEEDDEVRQLSEKYQIHLIPLVAPTSNERIRRITAKAAGFVYCVSSLGVTGVRSQFYDGIDEFLQTVRDSTTLPIAVGFGVSTNEHFRNFATKSDGVIVGSAIIRTIEEVLPLLRNANTKNEGLAQIRKFVSDLKGTH